MIRTANQLTDSKRAPSYPASARRQASAIVSHVTATGWRPACTSLASRSRGRSAPSRIRAGTAGEPRRHLGAGAGAGDALGGVFAGDAWAWAGTTTDSTMGLIHLVGMRMATVAPPTNILRTRRRVVLPSLIGIPG